MFSEAAAALKVSSSGFDCCTSSNTKVQAYCCKSYLSQRISSKPDMYASENVAE
jgi:hypothetical protein